MNQKKKKIVNKYIREIKHLFPVVRQSEKRFLADIRQNVDDYCQDKKDITFDMLVHIFGKPKDLVSHYITEKDASTLREEIRISRNVKHAICIILGVVILLAGFRFYTIYLDYQNSQKAQIDHEVIVIEEETNH